MEELLLHPGSWEGRSDGFLPTANAAIAASGLLDLARQTKSDERAIAYHNQAMVMLDVLSTPEYLARETPGWEGILKHGVYHTKKNLGVDESVMWGDFFYVEALTKMVMDTPLAA